MLDFEPYTTEDTDEIEAILEQELGGADRDEEE